MGLSDFLGAAGGMLDANQTKKKYPDDWPVLEKMSAAWAKQRMVPDKVPGELALVTKQRSKSLLKLVEWKSITIINPLAKSVMVGYYPPVMLAEEVSTPLFEFVARVNDTLRVGCFVTHGPFEDPRTGKSVVGLKYRIALIYADYARQPIQGLLNNLVRNTIDVADSFEPAFQALAKGASAIEALRMIKPMAPPRPAVGGDKILLDALLQGLSQQGMKYQPASDQQSYAVTYGEESNQGWTRTARVTDDRRVVVESMLDVAVSEDHLGDVLAFLDIANDKFAGTGEGAFHYGSRKVGYRTIFDARDAEKELIPGLIAPSLELHQIREDIVLNGVKEVLSGLSLNEAIQKVVSYLSGDDEE